MRKAGMWLGLALVGLAAPAALAVGYASGVTDLGGGMYSFVLNEDAVSVVIERTGDTPLDLGPLTRGVYTFSIGAGTGFAIKVRTTTPAGWAQYLPDAPARNFYVPTGVSVNKNPASPNFGKIYISNASAGTTGAGRATLDGIYVLLADGSDAGFATGGVDWVAAGTSSPFKSVIGPDDHLYVADFSRDLAWEFNDDLSVATQLIDGTNKTASQWVESLYVSGTQAAGNRKLYLVDSNYYSGAPGRKGLIEYTLGAQATATSGDLGVQYIGPSYFGFYPRDVARDADGNWYMNQYRADPTQASAITKFLDGPPPINTAAWETPKAEPYSYAYGIDASDTDGVVAYGKWTDGFVHIFALADGSYLGGFDAGSRARELAFDIAGNIVTVDNLTEYARFWTPGGDWLCITRSDGTFTKTVPGPALCAGDMDCSGVVDFDDIDLFVEALSYPGGAGWPHPCPWLNGDCNGDSLVNFDDIDPFVARIGAVCD